MNDTSINTKPSENQTVEKSESAKFGPEIWTSRIPMIFEKLWRLSTDDRNLTLYGFRRFKTSHLINLRFLEQELAHLDHMIYQMGLDLKDDPTVGKRLGLQHSIRDSDVPKMDESLGPGLVKRLRELIKEYDDALLAFNKVMQMETFALADNPPHQSLYENLSTIETYKTRLIRVDLAPRVTRDACQRLLHRLLRMTWNFRQGWKSSSRDTEKGQPSSSPNRDNISQNTIALAEFVARLLVGIIAGIFLILPLAMVSYEDNIKTRMVTISLWIVMFAFLISLFMKPTSQETMAATAAYAAVLAAFVSNSGQS